MTDTWYSEHTATDLRAYEAARRMSPRPELIGKHACRFCHHDQWMHNPMQGCPFCRCAATPGEASARTEREDHSILPFHAIWPGYERYEPQETPVSKGSNDLCTVEAQIRDAETNVRIWSEKVEHLQATKERILARPQDDHPDGTYLILEAAFGRGGGISEQHQFHAYFKRDGDWYGAERWQGGKHQATSWDRIAARIEDEHTVTYRVVHMDQQ